MRLYPMLTPEGLLAGSRDEGRVLADFSWFPSRYALWCKAAGSWFVLLGVMHDCFPFPHSLVSVPFHPLLPLSVPCPLGTPFFFQFAFFFTSHARRHSRCTACQDHVGTKFT